MYTVTNTPQRPDMSPIQLQSTPISPLQSTSTTTAMAQSESVVSSINLTSQCLLPCTQAN